MRVSLVLTAGALAGAAAAQEPEPFDDGVLHAIELTFHQTYWWEQLIANYPGDTYLEADLSFDGKFMTDIGVRLRGESTFGGFFGSKKKPFRLQTDAFVAGQHVGGHDALRLNNGAMDPTFLREALMANTLGKYVPMSRRAFSWLVINGEPWGVYILEQQKDGQWAEEWFGSDQAHRYKAVYPNVLEWLGPKVGKYKHRYTLVNPGAAPKPHVDLVDAIDRLNNGPLDSLIADLDPALDVDSALWHFAGDNAFGNMDSYLGASHNFYVVGDGIHDRLAFQAHDLDGSFGTWGTLQPDYPVDWAFHEAGRPLSHRLWKAPGVPQEYLHHLGVLAQDEFSWATGIGVLARRYHRMLDEAVLADPQKHWTYQAFKVGLTDDVAFDWGKFRGLKRWVSERRAFLLSHPAIASPRVDLDVRRAPARPDPGQAVTITARVLGHTQPEWVQLRHRVQGHFERALMRDDGGQGDGAANDGLWGLTLPPMPAGARVEYVVVAAARQTGTRSTFPRRGEQHPFAFAVAFGGEGVRVTELMHSGADGEFVEMTNLSGAPVDLAGWSLDDQSAVPGTFDLSSVGVLDPRESVIVTEGSATQFAAAWGVPSTQVLGGNSVARLGSDDAVHLFDGSGALVDRLVYGAGDFPGSVDANATSAWVCGQAVGRDDVHALSRAEPGDAQGSWNSSGGDVGSPGSWVPATCPGFGQVECRALPNSSGLPAGLSASGSPVLAHDDLHLRARDLPAAAPGLLLASAHPGHEPGFAGGAGLGCLGVPRWRFANEVFVSDASGVASLHPDLLQAPDGMVVLPGETWRFQVWFRDHDPTPTSNTSHAVAVTLR